MKDNKRQIRLSEHDLNRVITKSVKAILNEGFGLDRSSWETNPNWYNDEQDAEAKNGAKRDEMFMQKIEQVISEFRSGKLKDSAAFGKIGDILTQRDKAWYKGVDRSIKARSGADRLTQKQTNGLSGRFNSKGEFYHDKKN